MTDKTNKRLEYVDVAKGLLIAFVFLGHMAKSLNPDGTDEFLSLFTKTRGYLWTSYYMPAFFVITGFCSNFSKSFKSYLVSNIKRLIVPAIVLVIPISIAELLFHKVNFNGFLIQIFITSFWFLRSLFISKIVFYFVYKFAKYDWQRIVVNLSLFALGLCLYEFVFATDRFNVIHSLLLLPFLELGVLLRRVENNKIYLGSVLVYCLTVLFFLLAHKTVPSITYALKIQFVSAIPFLILSSTGSISILWIGKIIGKSTVFQTLGKHSLVLYCLHVQFYFYFSRFFLSFTNQNWLLSAGTLLLSTSFLLLICLGASILLNKKPLSVCLGEF